MSVLACGIDPGLHSGLAIVRGEEVLWSGLIDLTEDRIAAMARGIDGACECLGWERGAAIVEGQWSSCDPEYRARSVSAMGLARLAGQWEAVLTMAGWDVHCAGHGVSPGEWRAAMLGGAYLRSGRAARPALKRAALSAVQLRYGIGLARRDHDIAEAILIAAWLSTELEHEARLAGASR